MKKKISFTLILALLVFVLNVNAQMRVHLINVGQGSATLIEFPCAAILIDAGGETNALYNSSDALKTYLDDFFTIRTDLNHTLQCVYLTHPHKDHTLGVPVILQPPYVIKNVVTDGLEEGSGKAGQIKLHRLAEAGDIGFEPVTTNKITGNAGLTNAVIDPVNCTGTDPVIKVLWGTSITNPGWSNTAFNSENNHSLVIKIEYGTSSMLITGDLEEAGQRSLLSKYNGTNVLDADVYLVGHHGSKNGTSQELLNKITPQMALIGMGDPSRELSWTAWAYGHPNKGILDSLQKKITATRTPIRVQAGTGAKKFDDYTVSKAIYATGWDDDVVLEADAAGNWHKAGATLVPALVNINTASASELETLPGIGATKAQAIITHRTSHGNFTSVDQLDNVPGIGPATINLLKPYATVQ
ncbi:MAG TPA: helix-hairpin-helix domain-containing protein [Bacteroidia bacterium]|nr:helix-hairpin-helix domain-containing protein [Bacteroidia bacterium]